MKHAFFWIVAGALALSIPGVSFAQQQIPAASATKAAAVSDDAKKAKAKQCSDQADAKKLHGMERKAFREKCKRA
jgi:uncharacterized protein HemX